MISISLATKSIDFLTINEVTCIEIKHVVSHSSMLARLVGSFYRVKGKARLYPRGPVSILPGALLTLSRNNVANNRASRSQAVFTTIFPEV